MLCPPSSQVMESPRNVCIGNWLIGCLVFVFGRLGWLLGWLVGCWLISSWAAEFGSLVGWVGWLVGWLVGWVVAWLVSGGLVARVYVCVLPGHMLCAVVAQFVCV